MNSEHHHKRKTCRICDSNRLQMFLSLGHQPLANSFLKSETEFPNEAKYPLDVYFCENCALVQLLDVIDPEVLFRHYIYLTGTSDTIAAHNREYARSVSDILKLTNSDLVVEVASNDGSLLRCFKEYNVRVLGVEPATNIAKIASNSEIETINEFFNSSTADRILSEYGSARAVIANNVLAHVDETRDFMLGCKELLTKDGLVIIEVPHIRELLDQCEYDTIYHEHLCYFSVNTLMRLCESVGLSLVKIDRVPVHGGSIRIYAGLSDTYGYHTKDVLEIVSEEQQLNMNKLSRYEDFAMDVKKNRATLSQLLESLHEDGKIIAGYGAPAKGNTLLNYCSFNSDLIKFTVDKNPLKVGLYTPGMHLPVLAVDTLLEQLPDYVLILAWNFAPEIMQQQREYYNQGGKFIIPIPEPRIV